MRSLRNPWRWPLAVLASVLLLLFLAAGAARYYPAGELAPRGPDDDHDAVLVVMPGVEVIPEAPLPEPDEPDTDELPPPEPDLDVFRSLWGDWVAGQAVEVMAVPVPPDSIPRLDAVRLDWNRLFHAAADTSAEAALAVAHRLWGDEWQENGMAWAIMGHHAIKAARYQAMKKSVFNEDWLESEYLR